MSAAGAEAEAVPGQEESEELRHILGENAPSKVSQVYCVIKCSNEEGQVSAFKFQLSLVFPG